MLGDAVYTNSLGKEFIHSPERVFYAYYSGVSGHSIEEGMSSRDKVRDMLNSKNVVLTSDQKGNSRPFKHQDYRESSKSRNPYGVKSPQQWKSLVSLLHFHLHSCLFV